MNVRKMTVRTLMIMLLLVLLFLFELFLHRQPAPAYASFADAVNAAFRDGGFLSHLLKIALLLLFLAGAAETVLGGNDRMRLLRAFRYLLIFAGILLLAFVTHIEEQISAAWFQQLCSAVLAIALRLRFSALARIPGCGSKWILPFLVKGVPKQGTSANARCDLLMLYWLRLAMLTAFAVMLTAFGMFWFDNQGGL